MVRNVRPDHTLYIIKDDMLKTTMNRDTISCAGQDEGGDGSFSAHQ